jgi:glutathione synthase/RimK-type ligase-like ATP-grasp enzyme
MIDLLGVFREIEFSPGREDDDAAILESTAAALAERGVRLRLGGVETLATARPAGILAMCQSAPALAALDGHASRIPVINAPAAIRRCYRTETARLLSAAGLPFPRTRVLDAAAAPAEAHAAAPCWIKRGDVHAMEPTDVVLAPEPDAVDAVLAAFAARGIRRAVVQDHVEGTVVKFYGIADGRFFRAYTEADQPPAAVPGLWDAARACAAVLGLEVFGGDLVVTASGAVVVIDVNDWPSFARCREEAAQAIAGYVCDRLRGDDAAWPSRAPQRPAGVP